MFYEASAFNQDIGVGHFRRQDDVRVQPAAFTRTSALRHLWGHKDGLRVLSRLGLRPGHRRGTPPASRRWTTTTGLIAFNQDIGEVHLRRHGDVRDVRLHIGLRPGHRRVGHLWGHKDGLMFYEVGPTRTSARGTSGVTRMDYMFTKHRPSTRTSARGTPPASRRWTTCSTRTSSAWTPAFDPVGMTGNGYTIYDAFSDTPCAPTSCGVDVQGASCHPADRRPATTSDAGGSILLGHLASRR